MAVWKPPQSPSNVPSMGAKALQIPAVPLQIRKLASQNCHTLEFTNATIFSAMFAVTHAPLLISSGSIPTR